MSTPAPFVLVLSGAGVSADSGVPTFRDARGLFEGRRPDDVATPAAWARDPELVWRFYQERRAALRAVAPNAAHAALAALEARLTEAGVGFLLVTQNVDDLHERAGSRALVHMHGELSVLRCERCGGRERDLERCDPARFLACAACGHGRLRPDVVWFGEIPHGLERIEAALARCTHFLCVGTSGVVWPAAGLIGAARAQGAATWVQSLEPPENLAHGDRFVPGRAVDAVPALCVELAERLGS